MPDTNPAEEAAPDQEARVSARLDARGDLPAAGLADKFRLFVEMARERSYRVDMAAKVKLVACLLYVVSPIDLIPDWFFGPGFIDDAFVFMFGLSVLNGVVEDYRRFRARFPGGGAAKP